MGSIQNDTYSKRKRTEDEFSYNVEGIKKMLESYYTLNNGMDSIDIKIDLDRSLCSELLTPQQRITLAFVYAFELNILQTSKLLSCSILTIKETIETALEIIEAVINGYKTKRIKYKPCRSQTLELWINEVRNGTTHIFDIPKDVNVSLLRKLEIEQNDVLAAVKVKPKPNYRKHIRPVNLLEYPYHETSRAIESPTGKRYNPIADGYDYFYKQDTNNHVERNSNFNFPANLTKVGTKKVCIKKDNGYKGAKDIVYQ